MGQSGSACIVLTPNSAKDKIYQWSNLSNCIGLNMIVDQAKVKDGL